MIADVMREARNRMNGAITSLESDLAAFRTGRASTKLVEHLKVDLYEGFTAQARRAATMGMVGKWAIHPSQVGLANAVFTPPEARVQVRSKRG